MTDAGLARFGEALAALDAEIHWDTVARTVCDGDAEGFFSDERRDAILDAGLKHASDVGEALSKIDPEGKGRSLYVGAAVAELAPLLFEAIVLGRRVRWVTLKSEEEAELSRALSAVDKGLPRPHTGPWEARELRPVTHVWMASVLTDPVAFPALHDELYGRRGGPLAVGGGRPKAERREARALVDRCLDAMGPGALLTTSSEELPVWAPAVEELGGRLDVTRKGRLSGLVGDVLHQGRLTLPR